MLYLLFTVATWPVHRI